MHVTVTSLTGEDVFMLEVDENMALEDFKAVFVAESQLADPDRLIFIHNSSPLTNNKATLASYKIMDNDIICFQKVDKTPDTDFRASSSQGNSAGVAGGSRPNKRGNEDPEFIRQMFLASPHELSALKERNPELAKNINDPQKFKEALLKQRKIMIEREENKRKLLSNPLDPEAQRMLYEEIRLANINENMETAMEFSPESFGTVHMLYIDCKVNGVPTKAFVDSGAQMTIMSKECADRCNVTKLLDTRWAGVAKGVGVQKILGRAHMVQMEIAGAFLPTSFSVLEDQTMDVLLGLDMLRRHQCCIDLKENKLKFGTLNIEAPFLSEADSPQYAKMNSADSSSEDADLKNALKQSAKEFSSGQQSSSSKFNESDLKKIVEMGFDREEAKSELIKNKGDINKTMGALMARALTPRK